MDLGPAHYLLQWGGVLGGFLFRRGGLFGKMDYSEYYLPKK